MKEIMEYDVAVIGGGPAGMMAAIFSAQNGAHVILIEKNKTLGKKLLITGGGRCNITNAIFDNRILAKKYGQKGKFLLSPFSKWNAGDTIKFFEANGMPTKVEAEGRVFPKSDSARSVLDVLTHELKKADVKIITNSPVIKIYSSKGRVTKIETEDAIISAKTFIITTGGTARPETGSSGDGFRWLKKLGHTVNTPLSALVPIKTKEVWSHKLQGLSLSNARVTIIAGGARADTRVGKILFTHFGLSGPLILNMSHTIGEAIQNSVVAIELDIFPTLDHSALDEKLLSHLAVAQNKKILNALTGFLPPQLAQVAIELSDLDQELIVNKLSRTARIALVKKLKSFTITPVGLLGSEKAIVSSGGIALDEIDFKTMSSRKIKNLYLAGDILDFDRPSGGFSLQICWSTGFVAGTSATYATLDNPMKS
ncbi:MAG TPA: aminoacetone oxidase family FAD-binding enzyme [Candidatus Yonathbacteria bacterium]|uniref:Flavoprotein, HI0933 family n=1 Tax=Candidatus Nomurabacteria bacterium GW2011_GWC2_42_20 TaxID=1618756 RepID=A0A0G1BM39_9BACT|nr:MAG: Flavoprotein, HI0933 family [Candidatus Nomurabacteria bacterium GW2011_GWC2_42_20]KKT09449.1 MAG: Flavoprotein, HI0933 family [Candidatus Nomurabacteria bacterium GW2011_GWB1_43_20]TAN36207.1 MAG: NAD(P)/FAD-dependent oxidoreductase [Patescibacteria group bacterium]HBH71549.1 aminoacetone oxidase family FAD-binding enzyme [Candidatus Yonathbacteria bacterium]